MAQTKTLTLDDFNQWWSEHSSTYADKRNPVSCKYTTASGDHCIVGQFLADTGLPYPKNASDFNQQSIRFLSKHFAEYPFSDELLDFLTLVQEDADNDKSTWQEAINTAKSRGNVRF